MTPETTALTCPKCQGAMRSYERNGVTVDQCTECRGIFLDRGELERLMEAESAHYEDRDDRDDDRRRDYDRDREHDRGHEGKPRKKKRSFLSDMMEGFGGE